MQRYVNIIRCVGQKSQNVIQLQKILNGLKNTKIKETVLNNKDDKCHLLPENKNNCATAIILIVDRNAVSNNLFYHYAEICRQLLLNRFNCRVYFFFDQVSKDEFTENTYRTNEANEIVNDIHDTIQIGYITEPSILLANIVKFFNNFFIIRLSHFAQNFFQISGFVYALSQFFIVLCPALLIITEVILPKYIPEYQYFVPDEVRSSLIGYFIFYLSVFPIFVITHIKWKPILSEKNEFSAIIAVSTIAAFIKVSIDSHHPFYWIIWGIAAGVLLEFFRRNSYRKFYLNKIVRTGNMGAFNPSFKRDSDKIDFSKLKEIVKDNSLSVYRLPLYPTLSPLIFMSYSRRKFKSDALQSLLKSLKNHEIPTFLDVFNIPEGSCWRKILNRNIISATTFVIMIDNNILEREMPALELATALQLHYQVGLPEIVILIDKDFDMRLLEHAKPAYRIAIEAAINAKQNAPKIVCLENDLLN